MFQREDEASQSRTVTIQIGRYICIRSIILKVLVMGPQNAPPFVLFRGLLLCAVFTTAIESFTVSQSAYFLTLKHMQLKGFLVKRFKSPSQIWCSQSCLKNTWCTSKNFKLAPQTSDGKGTCELNKHDSSVVKENTVHICSLRKVALSRCLSR